MKINYKEIDGFIGCHHDNHPPRNKGIIRAPPTKDNPFGDPIRPAGANNNKNKCPTEDPEKCVDIGKNACQEYNKYLSIDDPNRCIGFGVHKDWGVQLYNLKAINTDLCPIENKKLGLPLGLYPNKEWKTYIQAKAYNKLIYSYTKFLNKDCRGYDIPLNKNSIYKEREIDEPTCKHVCDQLDNCKLFTYYKGNCYLKEIGKETASKKNCTLGVENGYEYLKKKTGANTYYKSSYNNVKSAKEMNQIWE